jgi:hypothetical protein
MGHLIKTPINPLELGKNKRREVSTIRATLAKRGRDESGLSVVAIACQVRVITSAIIKVIDRIEMEHEG